MGRAMLCWENWWSGSSSGSRTPCSFIPWTVAEIRYSMQIHWNQGSGLSPTAISVNFEMRMACKNVLTRQILDWLFFLKRCYSMFQKDTLKICSGNAASRLLCCALSTWEPEVHWKYIVRELEIARVERVSPTSWIAGVNQWYTTCLEKYNFIVDPTENKVQMVCFNGKKTL